MHGWADQQERFVKVAEIPLSIKSDSCPEEYVNSHETHVMRPERAFLDMRKVERDMKIALN